jgi:hypothetical protein
MLFYRNGLACSSIASCTNSCTTRFFVAMVGNARSVVQCPISRFTIKTSAVTLEKIPSRI